MKWKSPFCNGSDSLCCPVRVGMEKSLRTLSERWTKGRKRRSGHRVIRDRAAHPPLAMHTSCDLKESGYYCLNLLWGLRCIRFWRITICHSFADLNCQLSTFWSWLEWEWTSLHLISKNSVITPIIAVKLQFVLDKALYKQNLLIFVWLSFYLFREYLATLSV